MKKKDSNIAVENITGEHVYITLDTVRWRRIAPAVRKRAVQNECDAQVCEEGKFIHKTVNIYATGKLDSLKDYCLDIIEYYYEI